jgi:hypothetical protein
VPAGGTVPATAGQAVPVWGLAWLPIDERQHGPLKLEPQLRLDVHDRRRTETEAGSAHGVNLQNMLRDQTSGTASQ